MKKFFKDLVKVTAMIAATVIATGAVIWLVLATIVLIVRNIG